MAKLLEIRKIAFVLAFVTMTVMVDGAISESVFVSEPEPDPHPDLSLVFSLGQTHSPGTRRTPPSRRVVLARSPVRVRCRHVGSACICAAAAVASAESMACLWGR